MVRIQEIKYGEILLNDKTYYSDMVVWWDNKKKMLEKTHIVDLDLLKRILEEKPDCLVIGVGLEGTMKIDPKAKQVLEKNQVPVFVEKTLKAMEIYNAFLDQGKKVVGIMHVTL